MKESRKSTILPATIPLPMLAQHSTATTKTKAMKASQASRYRLALLVAHFFLTYPRWSWGLFLFFASRSLPLEPLREGLQQPFEKIKRIVYHESRTYETCTREFFSESVPSKRNQTLQVESQRIEQVQLQNQEKVGQLQASIHRCEQSLESAQNALRAWVQAQSGMELSAIFPLVQDKAQCSDKARHELDEWLWDESPSRRQVLQLFDDYRKQSSDSATRLSKYSMERSTYDYNYFVGQKMDLAWLEESWHAPDLNVLDIQFRNGDLLDAFDGQVLRVLNDAMVRVLLLEQRLSEFFESLEGFDANYREIYGRLISASGFVSDFLPRGIPIPSFFDLNGVPVADLLLPDVFENVHFDADLPELRGVRSRFLETLQNRLDDIREEIGDNIRLAVAQLKQTLADKFSLEDYHPPKFGSQANENRSIETELVATQELGEKTRANLDYSLRFGLSKVDAVETVTRAPNVGLATPPDLEGDTTFRDFLKPALPFVFLPRFFVAIFTLFISHRWLVEVFIQCFRAWQLYRRFLQTVNPIMPKIVYGFHDEEPPYAEAFWVIQKTILKHFTTPWMACGLILLPFAAVGTTLWLPHVKSSCVDSTSGTILGRHVVVPVLINQAMMTGNSVHVRSQMECHRDTERLCYEAFYASDERQRKHQQISEHLLFDLNHSKSSFHLMDSCIDVETLDKFFQSSCCGWDGYPAACDENTEVYHCPMDNRTSEVRPFLQLSSYLSEESCLKDIYSIEDGRFDCSKLSNMCSDSACSGVNRTLLTTTIISAECQIEVYFMKVCLSVFVALYHAIMINLFCTLIFNGMKQSWWRKICPGGIQLETHMNEKGEIVKGADPEERFARVAATMSRFDLMGKLQLTLGCGIFLLWFISFFLCRKILSKFR
eukprot:scaffold3330_cov164-Amphora_coffeaeformis.AAC.20